MTEVFQDSLSICPSFNSCDSQASLKPVGQVCVLAQFCNEKVKCLVSPNPRITCFSFLTKAGTSDLYNYFSKIYIK